MDRKFVILVLSLVILLVFFRRVSGFIITPAQVPLSMMDMQEFSFLTDEQKNKYRELITQRSNVFTDNTTNYIMYMQNVQGLLSSVIQPPV